MSDPLLNKPSSFSIVPTQFADQFDRATFSDENWSNIARVVLRRTYLRERPEPMTGSTHESFKEMVERVIRGNTRLVSSGELLSNEVELLANMFLNRKAMSAGRGLWFSGAPSHDRLGGAALINCWGTTSEVYENFVMAMDLLMLGGGVGMSVEQRFTSKLPKIKKGVIIRHVSSKDADFIVPDSREGWCDLIRRVFQSWFVTGRSFTYSTICLRGYGESIKGFGGKASGPLPLIECVENLSKVFASREGKSARPIDCADLLCIIASMVVAGNVRRSALMILGDPWDKDYLKAKRWDLGGIPSYRANANFSIVIDDPEDFHPLYWKTFEAGEAFGIFNRKATQAFGRMGEKKKDTAQVVNPCAEATLEDGESCNLQEIFLPQIVDEDEFVLAARLMHRYGKRVTLEHFHNPKNDEVIRRNRRIGTGITGCLQSPLFNPKSLDRAYAAIQEENREYSKVLGIPESIRTTVVKPSGTLSLVGDCTPGIHPAYSRYYIRRVRFAANDPLIPILRAAGHPMEPVRKFDGTIDHGTQVVQFFMQTPEGTPCADEGFDTWKQLDVVSMAQKHWADQAVSCSVYYKRNEISAIKQWLIDNLKNLKTISFLCHSEHGFDQAPLEAIDKTHFEKMSTSVKPLDMNTITGGDLESLECAGGFCPVK
jgi:ribonucleoside-triphosphate reductase